MLSQQEAAFRVEILWCQLINFCTVINALALTIGLWFMQWSRKLNFKGIAYKIVVACS